MNTTTTVHAARLARTLDNVAEDIRPALAACAAESCRLMLDNGWDPAGDTYEIGAMPGDRQAAEEAIGRALTREEVRALELAIRELLAAAALRWDLVPMFDGNGNALTRDERIRAYHIGPDGRRRCEVSGLSNDDSEDYVIQAARNNASPDEREIEIEYRDGTCKRLAVERAPADLCQIRGCDRGASGHGGHPDLCGVHADAEHALGRESAS